jgi:ABC-type Zn2+ transport system substrate-binding protein/surface adhesin
MRVCDMTTVTVAELATQMVNTLESNQSYPSAEFDALKAAVTARQDAYENLLKAVSGR